VKNRLIASVLLASGLFSTGLAAQQTSQCPDLDVRLVKASYDMSQTGDRCGVSLTFEWAGLKVSTMAGFCPLFVLFYPAHDEPFPRAGSGTYVRLHSTQPVKRVDYSCEGGFLFFSRGSCQRVGESNLGGVSSYELRPCAELAKAAVVTAQ
jgi:hypothetical protein